MSNSPASHYIGFTTTSKKGVDIAEFIIRVGVGGCEGGWGGGGVDFTVVPRRRLSGKGHREKVSALGAL